MRNDGTYKSEFIPHEVLSRQLNFSLNTVSSEVMSSRFNFKECNARWSAISYTCRLHRLILFVLKLVFFVYDLSQVYCIIFLTGELFLLLLLRDSTKVLEILRNTVIAMSNFQTMIDNLWCRIDVLWNWFLSCLFERRSTYGGLLNEVRVDNWFS